MINAIAELFLTEYFSVNAALGNHVNTEEKTLFFRLGQVFMLPTEETERLYKMCQAQPVKEIVNVKDFMRYQRMQQYSQMLGTETDVECDEIIRVKGNALSVMNDQKLMPVGDSSPYFIYKTLTNAASVGVIKALKIMGLLQCEGIFLDRNVKEGTKKLAKAADWNDIVSVLALLHYTDKSRDYNIARLRMLVENTPFSKLYAAVSGKYAVKSAFDIAEVKLLNKAFSCGTLNPDKFSAEYARILYSRVLNVREKEKTMFSNNSERLSVVGDLPLKLGCRSRDVDTTAVDSTPLNREAERAQIVRALSNADLRETEEYRPLCIVSDSKFLLTMYAKAIMTHCHDCKWEKIDVADLTDYDLEPTLNNIFVRSVDEDKDNRFMLFFTGDVPAQRMEHVRGFLQSARRAKFHLNSPNVTLNLGAVLPICFSNKQNAARLAAYCDTVQLQNVTDDEVNIAVADIIQSKKALYGVEDVVLAEEARKLFDGADIDRAEKAVDDIIRQQRNSGKQIIIDRASLVNGALGDGRRRIGFGG